MVAVDRRKSKYNNKNSSCSRRRSCVERGVVMVCEKWETSVLFTLPRGAEEEAGASDNTIETTADRQLTIRKKPNKEQTMRDNALQLLGCRRFTRECLVAIYVLHYIYFFSVASIQTNNMHPHNAQPHHNSVWAFRFPYTQAYTRITSLPSTLPLSLPPSLPALSTTRRKHLRPRPTPAGRLHPQIDFLQLEKISASRIRCPATIDPALFTHHDFILAGAAAACCSFSRQTARHRLISPSSPSCGWTSGIPYSSCSRNRM